MLQDTLDALERKSYLVEFVAVVAIVLVSMLGATILSLYGQEDSIIAGALVDVMKVGFGAVIALAYAASGGKPPIDRIR